MKFGNWVDKSFGFCHLKTITINEETLELWLTC